MLEYKGWILYSFFFGGGAFEVEVLWGVGLWLIPAKTWPFMFFIRMSKNGNSFELCSIVYFILGCRFCSRLCNSLMSPHGHFQNTK